MARKSGLGPQGRTAVERAFREASAPVTTDIAQGNPAVTSTAGDERQTLPAPEDWWTPAKPSSRVAQAGYDPGSERLYVLFHKPFPGGTPWTYEGVSPGEWANFRRAPSPGRYVNDVLNGKNYHPGAWA